MVHIGQEPGTGGASPHFPGQGKKIVPAIPIIRGNAGERTIPPPGPWELLKEPRILEFPILSVPGFIRGQVPDPPPRIISVEFLHGRHHRSSDFVVQLPGPGESAGRYLIRFLLKVQGEGPY